MNNRPFYPSTALLIILAISETGCSRNSAEPVGAHAHQHEHKAPHGGTAVVLGNEAYHVELVLDPTTGRLQAYLLDGEMENFVRLSEPSIEINALVEGVSQTLVLLPVANAATGEIAGDTALFEVQARWLRTAKQFDAALKTITIRGTTFTDVKFNFPKGNEKD